MLYGIIAGTNLEKEVSECFICNIDYLTFYMTEACRHQNLHLSAFKKQTKRAGNHQYIRETIYGRLLL